MKSAIDYHFERKKQLQNYKGSQSRLLSILEADHGEAIKDSMVSPIVEKEKETISKEEFIRRYCNESESN